MIFNGVIRPRNLWHPKRPLTDVSRWDHTIRLAREEMDIIAFKGQESRLTPEEWDVLLRAWHRIFVMEEKHV